MEEKYAIRIKAIQRYLAGERPTAKIYQSLKRNKQWFYFWLKRYNSNHEHWYKDRPRCNKIIRNRTDAKAERFVCTIRAKLAATKYAQIGALAIQWEMQKLRVQPLPVWTINRIIRRHHLIRKSLAYEKRNTFYPTIPVTRPHCLHQMDLVGPRYIGSGPSHRFYSCNLIDAYSNAVSIKPYPSKEDIYINDSLVLAWQTLGLPQYLQIDNELSFKGSNRYPRTLGRVLKLCLYLGVEVIFIPEGEPWRQGVIEKFNDVYDKMFFRSQRFKTLTDLHKESHIFEHFHNHHHRYSKLQGKTPWIAHQALPKRIIPESLKNYQDDIPFTHGKISFVRLTNKNGTIRFFTETFLVDTHLVHEYVKGTIYTKAGILKLYYNNKAIKTYRYKVNPY
jgi:putative transposase